MFAEVSAQPDLLYFYSADIGEGLWVGESLCTQRYTHALAPGVLMLHALSSCVLWIKNGTQLISAFCLASVVESGISAALLSYI